MVVGILKEPAGENRVSLLPESVQTLVKLNVQVVVEEDAGMTAFFTNSDYQHVGATILPLEEVLQKADVILRITCPEPDEIKLFKSGKVLISVLNPLLNTEVVKELAAAGITSFSMDMIPRTSRAQAMDILSSMATVAGYKAVLTAALNLPNFFPMFMTAAGTIKPAKVLILGAGVAGLQAIATSRKLGAQVEVFDVRAAVKEEVMSLGAKFVEVDGARDEKSAGGYAVDQTEDFKKKQRDKIAEHAMKANVIICTAQIPGKRAPILVDRQMVEQMQPGSVIVDLAASTGGNCELTQNNQTIIHDSVKIIGNSNFASEMPSDASKMYGKNVINFMKLIIGKEGELKLNFTDDIVQGTCMTYNKEISNKRVKDLVFPVQND